MGSDQSDLWGGPWTHLAGAGPIGERTTGQEECAVCGEGVPHSLGSLRVSCLYRKCPKLSGICGEDVPTSLGSLQVSHADIYKEHETVRLLHFVLVQSSNAVKTKIKMEKLNNL